MSERGGQDHRRREWQSGSQQRPDDGHPSTSSKLSRRDSLSEDNVVRRFSRESIRLSSRGSYSVEWRWSGDVSDSPSEQGSCSSICLSRSDSLEGWTCPPLPEKPSDCRKRKGFGSFLKRLWKTLKRPFCCCFHCSSVDVVEPFVPSSDLESEIDPEPSSPAPDRSSVKPYNESFESLYYSGKMIGSGTFGSVFEGTRKFDGKKVAIKRMRKFDNFLYLDIPGHPEPLITEVALLLMMRREPISPFVIQLYEWFEHPRKFTLVMEYPEPCESLLDFIDRNPPLDETIARVFMRPAVLAVQHCIEHDVFHNDIHADNFLLKQMLEIKLIDFGCGQLFSSDGYESDVYVGIQDHCPPEVFTDPRFHAVPANFWALGVMLYKMVNACPPFRNRTEITQAKVTFQNSNLSKGWTCPPLPGQVPLEPTETSHGRTAPGAREASPVTKSSTEKPSDCRKRKGFGSFLKRLWKTLKRPFCCCFHCSSVDVVEPFVPSSDLESEIDPEPSSPAPDRSDVKPYNGKSPVIISPTLF
ncbi:Serine/threonine-protein kinase pim-2 [Anabarilius grahami]|uniref:non-specific serine/threonine protein kinase n=1 Tax=Anabarilius grahami TaxID=495550 RepID=A0A3N0YPC2_ANAGA|nr:Serine/threonine-protein kinase pim-2 [Anabarilius grahami]